MNKLYYLCLSFIFFNNYLLNSSVGCMDNSYHMTKPCDRKNLHYVRCECPCKRILNQKGICLECRHIGDPDRGLKNLMQLSEPIFR